MLETKEIAVMFDSLQDFEKFNLEWTSICARLNPSNANVQLLSKAQKRARKLGIE